MFTWIDQSKWADLYALAIPGKPHDTMGVQGFVLIDTFDELLRKISTEYIEKAWTSLRPVLEKSNLLNDDLTWGWMHPGHSDVNEVNRWEPHRFLGVVSRDLPWKTRGQLEEVDKQTRTLTPPFAYSETHRAYKWNIHPGDSAHALRLVEMMCLGEVADWTPSWILSEAIGQRALWHRLAEAIQSNDQNALDTLMGDANREYSEVGYRILRQGFQLYLSAWADQVDESGDAVVRVALPPVR